MQNPHALRAELFRERGEDALGDFALHVPAEPEHLFDHRRAHKGIAFARREEDGLDLRREMVVHKGQGKLVLKITDRAEPPNNRFGVLRAREINQQAREADDLCVLDVAARQCRELGALLKREERILRGVLGDRHHDGLEYARGAADYIEVPEGDRIETPRVDGFMAFHGIPPL